MIVPCKSLWPPAGDPIEAILHWGWLSGALGAEPSLPRPFLIALRGVEPYASETHDLKHAPRYDDCFIFYAHGKPTQVFNGATHAYQRDSRLSPDVDGDGRGDVGSIRPGRYLLTDLRAGEEVIFHITNPDGTDRLPAWRDYDHDGQLSVEEMQRSESARKGAQVGSSGTWASSILLHGGVDSPPGAKHRFSIGCFTAPVAVRAHLAVAAKPYGGKIDLVLMNAWDLIPLAEERARKFTTIEEPFPLPPENNS